MSTTKNPSHHTMVEIGARRAGASSGKSVTVTGTLCMTLAWLGLCLLAATLGNLAHQHYEGERTHQRELSARKEDPMVQMVRTCAARGMVGDLDHTDGYSRFPAICESAVTDVISRGWSE